MTIRRTLGLILALTAALCGVFAGPAAASRPTAFAATTPSIPVRDPAPPPGAQVLTYRYGPMTIKPGQNLINVDIQQQRPSVNGWIVGFRPSLVNASDGKAPPVTEVHLHHAVWLVALKPTFAAGEEKTNINAPEGYGWRYTTKQFLVINHMIHDLSASPKKVYITYTLWFIPDTAPEAASIKEISTLWMDVEGGKPYPVFDALRGSGTRRHLHVPRPGPRRLRAGAGAQHLGRGPRRDPGDHGRPSASGRSPYGSVHHSQWGEEATVPFPRRLFRTRRIGFLGRVDERDRPELEGRHQEGRRAVDQRDL